MIEPNYRPRFSLKPLQALGIGGKAHRQKFECGLAARCHVGGQIDVAHPAGADSFRNFVVADRATDEQISLPVLDNARSKTGDWGFNEGVCSLMRSEECFHLTAQKLITFTGRVQECANLVRLSIQRCVKDFLNRLKSPRRHRHQLH